MNPDNKTLEVAQIFVKLGASEKNAKLMARQLIKRAEQVAKEKKTSKIEELQKLLEISVLGAQGRLHPSDETNFRGKNAPNG